MMTPTNRNGAAPNAFHAVRFFRDEAGLCRMVADFLGEGLKEGQPAIAIATPAHREEIQRKLGESGFDVQALIATGDFRMFDAGDTLSTFAAGTSVDPGLFRAHMATILDGGPSGPAPPARRVYGEMVDLLWGSGRHRAAIRLEMLWNELAASHSFALLCSYSMGSFYKKAEFDTVYGQHSHEVSEEGSHAPIAGRESHRVGRARRQRTSPR